jgi:hypothetical protein
MQASPWMSSSPSSRARRSGCGACTLLCSDLAASQAGLSCLRTNPHLAERGRTTQGFLAASDEQSEPREQIARPSGDLANEWLHWWLQAGEFLAMPYRHSQLDEIEKIAIVGNHWWNGFGIRMAAGFRLYNVSGLDAVELRLKSNEIRRIGTDDPRGLAEALKSTARQL